MTELAIILGCAAVAFGIARWLKIAPIPVLMVAGFLLGKTNVLGDPVMRYNMLLLGVGFLLFFVGTELNPNRIKHYRSVALKIGFAQFFVLGAVGLGVALLFSYSLTTSAYIALALAASSTLVVVRMLQQRRQMFEPFGRTVLGVLLLQDTIIVLLLPFLYKLEEGLLPGLLAVVLTVGMAGVATVMLRWVVPWLVRRLYDDDEVLLLVVLAIFFLFVGAAYLLDLPIVTGAFIAGVALSSFPASGFVRLQFSPLSDFFTSLFFTVLGTLAVIASITIVVQAVVFALVVIIVTPLLVTLVGERSGLTSRTSIESGLLLSQTSELSLALILSAFLAGSVDAEVLSVIILVTIFTMILTPLITTDRVAWRLMHWHPSPYRTLQSRESPSDHILILGVGRHGIPLLETLLFAGYEVVVVDDDPAIVDELYEGGVPCLRGDASDPEVLRRVGADRASIIISLIRRPKENLAVLRAAGDRQVLVRVFEEEDAQVVRQAGGIPISFSDAAADGFIRWLKEWKEAQDERAPA